jgi:hypothetical protein
MENLNDIYRGMQNGAETINDNFNKLNAAIVHNTGDEEIAGNKTFNDSVTARKLKQVNDIAEIQLKMLYDVKTGTATVEVRNGVAYLSGSGNYGSFGAGGDGKDVFALPAGTRPKRNLSVPCSTMGGGNVTTLNIETSGRVRMITYAAANNAYAGFDVSFLVE